MPLDGLYLAALRKELAEELVKVRIARVYQPGKRELNLALRSPGQSRMLLVSAHPLLARVHLTAAPRENPLKPPPFCMLLRKYLEGGRLLSITQPALERILVFEVQNMDEFGLVSTTELVCEFMGKHSNVILVKKESGKILGSLIPVHPGMSRVRTLLPGEVYQPPPPQEKFYIALLEGQRGLFEQRLEELKDKSLKNSLVALLQGIGPLTAELILLASGLVPGRSFRELSQGEVDGLFDTLLKLKKEYLAQNFRPTLYYRREGEALDFTALPPPGGQGHGMAAEEFASPSLLLDRFFGERESRLAEKERRSRLEQGIQKKLESLQKKMARQEEELRASEKGDDYRRQGEVLTAYLHRVKRGDVKALLPDIYRPGEEMEIPLNLSLTPAQNAQVYFKKYKKALAARGELARHTRVTREEIRYLEGMQHQVEKAKAAELAALGDELAGEGYLQPAAAGRARRETRSGEPLKFLSSDGLKIYVGKNNRQNDWLTLKKADREDLWFHVKDMAGSHVVVTHSNPPYKTLEEAALLAAYYSRGQKSSRVPVDYTRVKNVRKPKGAKPGMVIYDNQKTLYVTPAREKLPPAISPE